MFEGSKSSLKQPTCSIPPSRWIVAGEGITILLGSNVGGVVFSVLGTVPNLQRLTSGKERISEMTQLNAYYPKEKLKEVRPIEAQGKGLFERFEGKVDGAKAVIQGQDASHVVALNSTVHLEDLDSGRQLVYTLVSSNSADITKNKVSAIAPLGRAILRRKSGDVVEFNAPAGLRTLRIKQIFDRPRDEDATTLDPGETAKARKQVA